MCRGLRPHARRRLGQPPRQRAQLRRRPAALPRLDRLHPIHTRKPPPMSDPTKPDDRKQELLLLGQIHGMVQSLQTSLDQQTRRMDRMEASQEERHRSNEQRMEQSEARQQERHKANELRMDRAEERQEERHVAIDARLRVVEQKAAIAGAVSGSAVSIGVALAIEGLKQWLGRGGLGQ
ncbi:hypothetical protein FRC90_17980 [Paracidovorax citrulli]|nr:hypothetical protein FRC90_17980 [Paracidovorax citrulli]